MKKLMLILVVGMILAVGTVLAVTVITISDPLSKGLVGHWELDGNNIAKHWPWSCKAILDNDDSTGDGVYSIDPDGPGGEDSLEVYCDMTTDGGGWTMVMQTSDSSAYVYDNNVWTNTSGGLSSAGSVSVNQDYVSKAFYSLSGTQSMLALGSTSYWNSWNHSDNTARNLANQVRMSGAQGSAGNCGSQTNCGAEPINLKPQGVEQGTSGTTAGAWHRFGYVNDVNAWGPDIRVGFSGDNDASDSSDTVMGLGLVCNGNCATYCITAPAHDTGSGYYFHTGWGTAPLDDAVQGWLFIREDSANILNDTSDKTPNENYGIIHGATSTTDRMGSSEGAMEFDGTNDYIDAGNDASLNITDAITVSAWVKAGTQSNSKGIVSKMASDENTRSWSIYSQGVTNKLTFILTQDGTWPTNGKLYTTSIAVLDDSWHQVSFTFGSGVLKVYVDGVEDTGITKTTDNTVASIYPSSEFLAIGAFSNPESYFTGSIDDVRIYNRALSEKEIGKLYDSYKPKLLIKASKGLIGHWGLDGESKKTMRSCKAILDSGDSTGDGVYGIDPDGPGGEDSFEAYCDMTTDGGGWTMVGSLQDVTNRTLRHAIDDTDQWGSRGRWRDQTTMGTLANANTADYKNSAYWLLDAKDTMFYMGFTSTSLTPTQWKGDSTHIAYTSDGFLNTTGGNFYNMFNDNYTFIQCSTKRSHGWCHDVTFDKGSSAAIYGYMGTGSAAETTATSEWCFSPDSQSGDTSNAMAIPGVGVTGWNTEHYSFSSDFEHNCGETHSWGDSGESDWTAGYWSFDPPNQYIYTMFFYREDSANVLRETNDKTPNGNHGAIYGTTSTTDRMGKSNGAMSFDGDGDYVHVPDSFSLDTVSYSFWLLWDGLGTANIDFITEGDANSNMMIHTGGASGVDGMRFMFNTVGALDTTGIIKSGWNYYTFTYDGTTAKCYRNGVQINSAVVSWNLATTAYIDIGKRGHTYDTYYLDGKLSDFRIYDRALSDSEIESLYSAYKPKASASNLNKGLVLDMPLTSDYLKTETVGSEIVTDKTPYSNDGQNYGATIGSESTDFDGSDYVAGFNGFLSGLTELSISAWVNPSSLTYIFQHGSSGSHHGYINFFKVNADGSLTIDVQHAEALHFTPSSNSGEVGMNEWSHVGAIIDSDSIDFYVNGELIDSNSFSGMYPLAASAANYRNIGRYYYTSSVIIYSTGDISSVKIYNRPLSTTEAKLLYDKGR